MGSSTEQIKTKEVRWRQVQSMWAANASMRDICKALGWSQSQLAVQMRRMRVAGWDLPHRRRHELERDKRGRWVRKHGRPRGR